MVKGIKRALMAAMFSVAMLGLSATSSFALQEGCSPEFKEILDNRADALRVRDKAFAREHIRRPDPTAGMTCFDQAVGVTGRLGSIFSDKHNSAVPAANTVVFTEPLAYPDWGAGQFLVKEIEKVVMPPLEQHLRFNFGGVLSANLGTTMISSKITGLLDSLMGPINDISTQISGFSGQISGILSAINTIQSIAQALNLPLPSPVIIGTVAALKAAQGVANSLMSALQSAMNAAIMPIINGIMGQVMGAPADMECDNLSQQWNDNDPSNNVRSHQGDGLNVGAPFVSVIDIARGNYGNGGTEFIAEIENEDNDAILLDMLEDLDTKLNAPGTLPSWKTVPTIPLNSSVTDIISAM